MQVTEVKGEDVVCFIKSSATLAGPLYTLHVSQIRIELSTLTDKDTKVISSWAVRNKIDILSLSYTRNAEDVRHVESTNATDESILKVALDHGKTAGVIRPHDRVVVFQKVGDYLW
uniref:Pyruvate kinase n=1 Tax=Solanum tuberosum TaxID=4113 RepID=M1CM02_SOLTU